MADRAPYCSRIDDQDYEVLYIQGALPADEVEAFESHYFGCDRCWAALLRALELHAALTESGAQDSTSDLAPASAVSAVSAVPAVPTVSTAPAPAQLVEAHVPTIPVRTIPPSVSFEASRRASLRQSMSRPAVRPKASASRWWVATAGAAVILMLGIWHWERGRGAGSSGTDAHRGAITDLRVRLTVGPDSLGVTWSSARGAARYRVRLYAVDGTLLVDREVSDTSVSVGRNALGRAALPGDAFWSIDALDASRRSVARSRLTPAGPAPGSQ